MRVGTKMRYIWFKIDKCHCDTLHSILPTFLATFLTLEGDCVKLNLKLWNTVFKFSKIGFDVSDKLWSPGWVRTLNINTDLLLFKITSREYKSLGKIDIAVYSLRTVCLLSQRKRYLECDYHKSKFMVPFIATVLTSNNRKREGNGRPVATAIIMQCMDFRFGESG